MLIVSTETLPGYEITEIKGFVFGVGSKARSMKYDPVNPTQNLFAAGGAEAKQVNEEARKEALRDLERNASKKLKGYGENRIHAIIGVKFDSVQWVPKNAEVCAYGTLVKMTKCKEQS